MAGNLASEWWELASKRVLSAWIDLAALRPNQSETMTLLNILAVGPDRAKVAGRIARDPACRRSSDVLRQWQMLSPQDEAPYLFEQDILDLLDDSRGIVALHDRLGRVALHASTRFEDWMSGRMDEYSRKDMQESNARYTRLLDKGGADKKVRAAVLVLYAQALRVEVMIGDASAATAERERMLAEAAALWPIVGIERELAGIRVEAAILGAAAESAEVRAVWNAKRRSHHRSLIAHAITETSPAARDALRRQPKLAEARRFFERLMDDDSLQLWVFARTLGDVDMERRAAEALRGSTALIKARLDVRLRPNVPWAKEYLALAEKIIEP